MPVQPLAETLTSLTLGVGGLVGTNIENVVVAVAAFCNSRTPASALGIGFVVGLVFLLAVSWLTGLVAGLLPPRFLGYLGVIPIALGLREFFRQKAPLPEQADSADYAGLLQSTTTVALLMVANGVDTIAVFAPLIAESEATDRLVLTVGYVCASLMLGWFCVQLCTYPRVAAPIERYGSRVAPFLMIGIGVYILLNTGTDTLP